MKGCSIFTILCLFFPLTIFAQEMNEGDKVDIITLYNGRQLEGKIIQENTEKDEFRFQISENHVLFLRGIEIREIRRNVDPDSAKKKKTSKPFHYPDKKFYSQLQLGLLTGKEPKQSWEESENTQSLSIDYMYGYVIHSWLQAGIGVGLNLLDEGYTLPTYLHLRGDMFPKQVTPFYEIKAGYHFPLYKEVEALWPGESFEASVEGSFLYSASLGLQFYTNSPYSFLFSIGYQQQEATHSYDDPFREDGRYTDKFSYQRLSIQAGIRF